MSYLVSQVCLLMHINMNSHIHTQIYIHIYTYLYIQTQIAKCLDMCINVSCADTHMQIHIHTPVTVFTHKCTPA